MNKTSFFVGFFALIIAFGAGDYLVNIYPTSPTLALTPTPTTPFTTQASDPYPNMTKELVESDSNQFGYTIKKRNRTTQLFEKFDLAMLDKVRIYRNILQLSDGVDTSPLMIYEIQGPQNQGTLTYLSIKLKLLDQMGATGRINEVTGHGESAFFYNDLNNKNTAYLVTQIGDNVFGFQYSKTLTAQFETVKDMINRFIILN